MGKFKNGVLTNTQQLDLTHAQIMKGILEKHLNELEIAISQRDWSRADSVLTVINVRDWERNYDL